MTTNGIGLEQVAPRLAAAGLDRVNVSLDTVRPDTFRDDHPPRPLRRRRRAVSRLRAAAGLAPVKINAVLLRGVNDDQAPELLRLVPRARLRAAVHRADAAGRPARLEPRADDHGRRDLRLARDRRSC